jgi:hypothetical protein
MVGDVAGVAGSKNAAKDTIAAKANWIDFFIIGLPPPFTSNSTNDPLPARRYVEGGVVLEFATRFVITDHTTPTKTARAPAIVAHSSEVT